MKYAFKTGALLALAIAVLGRQSFGANLDFNVPDGSWFTSTNWTPAGPPLSTDNARIGTAATLSTALARINTGGTANANNVVLGLDAGTNGTLRINNGSTLAVANNFTVGDAGTGTFESFDSSVTNVANNMTVGNQAGSTGTVTVHDDSAVNITGNLTVGNAGDGTLRVLNTTSLPVVQANNIVIGNQAGSTGLIELNIPTTPVPMLSPALLISNNNTIVGDLGNGTLRIVNGAFAATSGNAIIGQGAGGTGSVVVSGFNGFASEWDITGNLTVGDSGNGTLEIRNGGLVGSAPFVPNNVFIGRMSGATGEVIVDGTGSTLNVNNNIFIGGDGGGPGGQGELRITNSGTVNTKNITVLGPGSGDRGTLSVDSTYTLNDTGTLTFVGGRLNFVGDGTDFINDATLTNAPGPDQNGMFVNVGDGNSATIDGELSGNGQLVKTGTGTLVLNNVNNSYTGGTNINNGTVVVGSTNGFAPFSVFGDGNVNLNGDINTRLRTPEGTPLLYVILGDFNANTGQLYTQVGGTNSGVQSDGMLVTGNANLDPANSHLFVHRINGYNPNNGDTVTIIETFGTVNGQFSDAPPNAAAPNDFLGLIQPFAVYLPQEVDLQFGFAATFASVAKTPNQIATAEALDAAVAAGCIVNATNVLGNVPINTLRHAYDLIAPEELASMYEASFAQGMVQSLNLQHRMDDVRWGSTGFCADGFVIQDNHGYTKNDGKSVADKNPVEETAPPDYRWGSFITGTGELTKVGDEDANGDHHGYQLNNASFTMGVDYRVTDHWAIGLSGGYSHTTGELVDDGRMNTDGGRMGLYTTWYSGGFYVDAAASGGWNQYDTRRTAYLGTEQGSTDGAEFDGMVAAGYDWKKGCWIFGPYADFEYSYVEFNSFTEGDTSLIPLHYPDQNQNAYRSNLGLRIAHEQVMKPGEGLTVVPEVRAAWRHDFGDTSYAVDSNFVGCDDTFTVHGPYIGRDSAVVDIGLTAYCTQQLSAYIFYQGQFGRDNYNNNAISGGLRFAF